jgi:hypothetical protein
MSDNEPFTYRYFLIGDNDPVRVKYDVLGRPVTAHNPDRTRQGGLKRSAAIAVIIKDEDVEEITQEKFETQCQVLWKEGPRRPRGVANMQRRYRCQWPRRSRDKPRKRAFVAPGTPLKTWGARGSIVLVRERSNCRR